MQGYADALAVLRYPYDGPESRKLNLEIFETIYYHALNASCDLARLHGPYETYQGSMVSKGVLHFDNVPNVKLSRDWTELRKKIAKYGVRNSLMVAPMPTATTAQIMGNCESFDPFTSNLYQRRTISGEFQLVNKYLIKDLISLNLWNDDMKQLIIHNNGSVQNIDSIPNHIKALYKTVWEISSKTRIDMAVDRGAFIDQSQSFNLYVSEPTYNTMTSIHFYSWRKGLKTGMYYLHTKPAVNAIQFTIDKKRLQEMECNRNDPNCSSCAL